MISSLPNPPAGCVPGTELELFVPDVDKLSPESCRQTIAACIDKKAHAISNAFLFAPIPAMDESAKYKSPYLLGNTRRNATGALDTTPDDFKKNVDWIMANPFRGVCGMTDMNNEHQEALHYPDNGFGNQSDSRDTGMSQLYVQVQDAQHKIIGPDAVAESKLRPSPWWS